MKVEFKSADRANTAAILRQIADRVEQGLYYDLVHDDGNTPIGHWSFKS